MLDAKKIPIYNELVSVDFELFEENNLYYLEIIKVDLIVTRSEGLE